MRQPKALAKWQLQTIRTQSKNVSMQQRTHATGGLESSLLRLWLAFLLICTAPAQTQQSLPVWQGVVRDARGAPVAGVIVRLTHHGAKAEAKSGTGGRFRLPPRFGTLGRNTFRGPAFYDHDFAFVKDTPFGRRQGGAERVSLQFREEFFNLLNIVNMGLPNSILGVSTNTSGTSPSASISTANGFGEISKTAGNSRQIQFSLKLIY
jgi:hypothetical protein